MTLVPSLLQAIVIMDGEALVLHVGDRPYVVTDDGQVTISNTPLTRAAIEDVLAELLTADSRRVLEELGATQWHLSSVPDVPHERFSVVAARGADDLWVEIRRASDLVPADAGAAPGMFDQRPAIDSGSSRVPDASAPSASRPVPAASGDRRRERDAMESVVHAESTPQLDDEPAPAMIVPLTQPSIRSYAAPPSAGASSIEQLLQLAMARGASALYLVTGAPPVLRIDADLKGVDGLGPMSGAEIESGMLALAADAGADPGSPPREWMIERADVGRVRCRTFVDARGPGGIVRFAPKRVLTIQQLGLPRELGALASVRDGLLLVAGQRGNGRRTLLASLVDQVNRTRHAHIVTIEREVSVLHERVNGLVTQVEVRGTEGMASAVRQALADDPDVLMVEAVHSADVLDLVLDAVSEGRLVLCGVVAPDVTRAIESWLDLASPASRGRLHAVLARHLRVAVGQVLVRATAGGRVAARELLLQSSAVSSVLAAGRVGGLAVALEAGRRQGMATMNDALLALVQAGAVDAAAACEASPAPAQLRTDLQRLGIDLPAVERRA